MIVYYCNFRNNEVFVNHLNIVKKWVDVNNKYHWIYGANSKIKFAILMLESSLCDYSDPCILVSGRIKINAEPDDVNEVNKWKDKRNKELIFKNCAPFIECTSEIDNTQINHTKDLDNVMSIHNLIKYSNNYSKSSGSLWKYHKDEPSLNNDSNIADLPGNSVLFKPKVKITGEAPAAGNTKDLKIVVPLPFEIPFKIPLINCKVNLISTCSSTFVIQLVREQFQ